MTSNISTTAARRIVVSTLAAVALTAMFPQSGSAATADSGIWKIDASKSKVIPGLANLTVERAGVGSPTSGTFVVVHKGNVYRVSGAVVASESAIKPVDYRDMAAEGKASLIGTHARSVGACGFRCQSGFAQPSMTLTFMPAIGAMQQINDMLAEAKH